MNIPESNYNLLELCIWAEVRNDTEEQLLRAICEDAVIADNQRDVWKNQNAQSEPFGG